MDIRQMRLRNLFQFPETINPTGAPLHPIQQQPEVVPQQEMIMPEPEHKMYDQMTNTLGNMPQRQPLSNMGRVGAVLSNLEGFGPSAHDPRTGMPLGIDFNPEVARKSQESFTNRGYDNKMKDWSTRFDAESKASDDELQRNIHGRTLAALQLKSTIDSERAAAYSDHIKNLYQLGLERGTDATERLQFAKEKFEKEIAEKEKSRVIADKRANAYVMASRGGKLVIDKNTGQYKMLFADGKEQDFDVEGFTPEDIQTFMQTRQIAVAGAKPESASNVAQARLNKINTLMSGHPEWKDYFDIDPVSGKTTGRTILPRNGDKGILNQINSMLNVGSQETIRVQGPVRADGTRQTGNMPKGGKLPTGWTIIEGGK